MITLKLQGQESVMMKLNTNMFIIKSYHLLFVVFKQRDLKDLWVKDLVGIAKQLGIPTITTLRLYVNKQDKCIGTSGLFRFPKDDISRNPS